MFTRLATSKKIYSTDPKTHLHAKAGDEFQVLRIHKDEGKLFVMNKRTWKKGYIPTRQFRPFMTEVYVWLRIHYSSCRHHCMGNKFLSLDGAVDRLLFNV